MSNYGRAQDEGLVRANGVRALGISIVNLVVGAYAESIGALLLVPVISMAVYFRLQLKEVSSE
jgi:hypothetical protein